LEELDGIVSNEATWSPDAEQQQQPTNDDAAVQQPTNEFYSKDLGEDLVRLQKQESDAQGQAEELANQQHSLQEKNGNLLHRLQHLKRENRLLKNEVKLAGQQLDQARNVMAGKVKKAFKQFVNNTKVLKAEIDRDRKVLEEAGVEKGELQKNLKELHTQLSKAERTLKIQEVAKKVADVRNRNSSLAWRHMVRKVTDSLDADEKKIASLQAQHSSDTKIIDSRVKELFNLRRSSGEKQSSLEKELTKVAEEAKKADNTIAENLAKEKLEKAKEETEKAGLQKEEAALKTENERLTQLVAQQKKDQSAQTAQLQGELQQQEEKYKAELENMAGAFKKASKNIAKIEAIDRGLLKKLNTSHTERRKLSTALKLANAKTAVLAKEVKSMKANNTALTARVKELRLELSDEAERHQEEEASVEPKGKRATMEDDLQQQVEAYRKGVVSYKMGNPSRGVPEEKE